MSAGTDENGSEGGLDRRTFMKASGGACFGALNPGFEPRKGASGVVELPGSEVSGAGAPPAPAIEDLPNPPLSERAGNFDQSGYPSREAYRDMAAQERRVQQQLGPLELREVNAVEYLGLGGGRSLTDALAGADLEGILLRFPPGEYPITGKTVFDAERFGVVGAGDSTVFRVTTGTVCQIQFLVGQRGRFENFLVDQTAEGACASGLLETSGAIEYRNVTRRGYVAASRMSETDQGIQLRAQAESSNAYIRVENWSAMGGTTAGSHSLGGGCGRPPGFTDGGTPGFWVGNGSAAGATVQVVNSELRGWENGFYASKTPTSVQIIGGRFVNNNNATIRIAGANSYANGCTVYYNADAWPESMPGPYQPGEIQGVNAVRSESKGTQMAAQLTNLDIQAYNINRLENYSCGGMYGLIRIQGTVGAGEITNCRLTAQNVNETPFIVVNRPDGSAFYPPPPAPFDIQISNVEIRGERISDTAIDIRGRSNSVVRDSCVRVPGASPADVSGARALDVGYGSDCSEAQLPQGPVGAPGNVSALNFSLPNGSVNGSAYVPLYSQQQTRERGIIVAIISTVLLLAAFLVGSTVLVLVIAGLVSILGTVIAYVVVDN